MKDLVSYITEYKDDEYLCDVSVSIDRKNVPKDFINIFKKVRLFGELWTALDYFYNNYKRASGPELGSMYHDNRFKSLLKIVLFVML